MSKTNGILTMAAALLAVAGQADATAQSPLATLNEGNIPNTKAPAANEGTHTRTVNGESFHFVLARNEEDDLMLQHGSHSSHSSHSSHGSHSSHSSHASHASLVQLSS
jgi:hypothetical protein